MLNRNLWQSYHRQDFESQWRWVGAGAFYGEAHTQAMQRTTGGQILVLFGRQLPEDHEHKHRRMPR